MEKTARQLSNEILGRVCKVDEMTDDEKIRWFLERSSDSDVESLEAKIKDARESIKSTSPLNVKILNHYILDLQIQIEKRRIWSLQNDFLDQDVSLLNAAINQCEHKIKSLSGQEEKARIDAFENITDEQKKYYEILVSSFQELAKSEGLWTIASDPRYPSEIYRKEAKFKDRSFGLLSVGAAIPNLDGCYIYPNYIIRSESPVSCNFKSYPITDITMSYEGIRFLEDTSFRPTDTGRVGSAYKYETINGQPDRRYVDNPLLPVYLYGKIHLLGTGLAYMTSSTGLAASFVDAFNNYVRSLKGESIHAVRYEQSKSKPCPIKVPTGKNSFGDIIDISNKLIEFYGTLSDNEAFCQVFKEKVPVDSLKESLELDSLEDVMLSLFRNDVIRAYLGLGYGTGLARKEGASIGLFIGMTQNAFEGTFYQEEFDRYFRINRQKLEEMLQSSEAIIKQNDSFTYVKILHDFDQQLFEEYVGLLYQFASLVSNADGTMNGTEYQWLNKLQAIRAI